MVEIPCPIPAQSTGSRASLGTRRAGGLFTVGLTRCTRPKVPTDDKGRHLITSGDPDVTLRVTGRLSNEGVNDQGRDPLAVCAASSQGVGPAGRHSLALSHPPRDGLLQGPLSSERTDRSPEPCPHPERCNANRLRDRHRRGADRRRSTRSPSAAHSPPVTERHHQHSIRTADGPSPELTDDLRIRESRRLLDVKRALLARQDRQLRATALGSRVAAGHVRRCSDLAVHPEARHQLVPGIFVVQAR